MYVVTLKGRAVHGFDHKKKTAISLADVIDGADSVYVGLRRNPAVEVLEFIQAFYQKNQDLTRLHVFADARSKHKDWAFLRRCTGFTAAVCSWLVQRVDAKRYDIPWPVVEHPAMQAVRYLTSNGGNQDSATQVVRIIGDISCALVAASPNITAAEIANNVWPVPKIESGFCARVAAPLASSVARYLKPRFKPATFCDHLIAAAMGADYDNLARNTFASDIIQTYGEETIGIAAAAVGALKLIVTSWAANEFHSDLFDEGIFNDCNPAGIAHAIKFKQLCKR